MWLLKAAACFPSGSLEPLACGSGTFPPEEVEAFSRSTQRPECFPAPGNAGWSEERWEGRRNGRERRWLMGIAGRRSGPERGPLMDPRPRLEAPGNGEAMESRDAPDASLMDASAR